MSFIHDVYLTIPIPEDTGNRISYIDRLCEMTHEEWMLAQAPVIEWNINSENFSEWSNIWNELSGNIPPSASAA